MNASNFTHALLAIITQVIFALLTKNWWIGAAVSSAFYFGREVAQHETDRLKFFGKRAEPFEDEGMPWYEGFKFMDWTTDGKFDFLVPFVFVVLIAYGMPYIYKL